MAEPGQDHAVIRTRRLEVVDGDGRVRAVLAASEGGDSARAAVGLEIFDAEGSARAWLTDLGDGVQLAIAIDGNQVAVLEAVDGPDGESSTSLVLCDRTGRPVATWYVAADGSLLTV